MLRNIIIILLTFLVITGCNQESKGTENIPKAEKTLVTQNENSQKEDQIKKEKNHTYQDPQNRYTIYLDERFDDELIIEAGLETHLYYDDKTVINDKVLIGTLEAMPLEEWKQTQENDRFLDKTRFVYYDLTNNRAYVYNDSTLDPYESFYQLNEDGDDYLPLEEATKYLRTSLLVELSLTKSNFKYGSIEITQEIPAQLDPNQEVGIELSEEFYADIKNWSDTIKKVADSDSKDGLYRTHEQVSNEVYTKYPELRQIPFPTFEIGYNIANSLERLTYWNGESKHNDEIVFLLAEHENRITDQYIEVIEKQIEELKNRF